MPKEHNTFRQAIGLLALIGGLFLVGGLFFKEIPINNRDVFFTALGIVLAWGSRVVDGEWGSSPAGRAASSAGIAKIKETDNVDNRNSNI